MSFRAVFKQEISSLLHQVESNAASEDFLMYKVVLLLEHLQKVHDVTG